MNEKTVSTIVKLRLTKEEKLVWQARANYFFDGNLSKMIRHAVNNYGVKEGREAPLRKKLPDFSDS
jgi:hypothetical protein